MSDLEGTGGSRRIAAAGLMLMAAAVLVAAGYAAVKLLRTPASAPASSAAGSAVDPQTLDEVLNAARTYMDQDKAGSAEVILSAAVERFPRSQPLRLLLGECLLQLERMPESYEQYEQAIFLGPDHAEYRHAAGTIASKIGRLEDAELHYMRAQSLSPSNPKFPLYLAQVQRKQGKNDAARASLVLATQLDPTLAIGWSSLAAIALDENRLEMAQHYIGKARAIEPEHVDWKVIEARVLRRVGDPSASLAVLETIGLDETAAREAVLLERTLALGMLGRTTEAANLYIEAVSRSPKNAELCYQAALWLERDKQPARAATYARHAVALGHQHAGELAARLDALEEKPTGP